MFVADKLIMYFQYPFVRYAMIVGVLIALCSSLLGVTLVLKRFSFVGDGLSHVAFGAIAIASVFNLTNNMYLVLPITIICAILLLRTGQNAKLKGDAVIAMISVGALAFGYLQHIVRIDVDTHAHQPRGMALLCTFSGCHCHICAVLQQDICRDL